MSISNSGCDFGKAGDQALIAAARQRMFSESGAPLALHTLAQTLGVSIRHLSLVFQRHFGVSVAVYARRERLRIAQRLLLQTSQPVQQIASQLGFPSPTSFSTAFRAYVGKTPSEFRKAEPIGQILTTGADVKWG